MGQEDPLEKGMATHSSILAWRSLGGSLWGCKELDMTEQPTKGKEQKNWLYTW